MLDADEALSWTEQILKDRRWQAFEKALLNWHASLGIFANGGDPPDPPQPPED